MKSSDTLPTEIYSWTMDIDYGHKSSMGTIYTIYSPQEIDDLEDFISQNLDTFEEFENTDGDYDSDGNLITWTDISYTNWMVKSPHTEIDKITDPREIEYIYKDTGIAGFTLTNS